MTREEAMADSHFICGIWIRPERPTSPMIELQHEAHLAGDSAKELSGNQALERVLSRQVLKRGFGKRNIVAGLVNCLEKGGMCPKRLLL